MDKILFYITSSVQKNAKDEEKVNELDEELNKLSYIEE